jgi:UDPglucose 6-dehydrogenase
VCVPTPYTVGVGFDDSFLLDAVEHVSGSRTVVIKSTVLPGTTERLQERHPQHRFMFNPEFLREATAYDDFVSPDRQIVGYTSASAGEAAQVMRLLPRAPFERICPASEAEMAKYVANSFLAVKVSYANEVFDLCDRMKVDYTHVRDIVAADVRIGPRHGRVHLGSRLRRCVPKTVASADLACLSHRHGRAARRRLHQRAPTADQASPQRRRSPGGAESRLCSARWRG